MSHLSGCRRARRPRVLDDPDAGLSAAFLRSSFSPSDAAQKDPVAALDESLGAQRSTSGPR